ncbi:MAG TPA: sigma-70 family RNA polymerase sigma factor [Nocardioides sp.]|uniref:RNA polymerase sigma factor n=1 Tax=uncultured Nocardioides sp. TaxID=198441 RepID=UPI0026095A7C|nr:sigma-70 family RNA polymerase sigma factor [uncultured Nocardioides sp.]HRD60323.1 sigma-70 family RNA polymerase sigma factor [Nocardioides sp.]HRI95576.1 sigma-70 family RNA polymerase sigma factor [Nocardioides sp.]HRK48481.1 sigma-70 family RNA polymerase sigma factor [Nocardioides sp.]
MSEMSRTEVAAPQRARAVGRTASFEEFYVAELPRLVALARGLCPAHVAEDVAQEAMLVAYRRWREVSSLERPDLWIRRTCANLAVSQFRRRLVELRATARLAGRRTPPVELSETSEEFWTAVRGLPQRQAQAAALRFVYDMPIADIAATLGTSEGTVKQHLSRARHALAVALDATPQATQEEQP